MLSFAENIKTIIEASKGYNKILDIGAGFGKYGVLLREQYLSSKAERGELSPLDDFFIGAVEDAPYFQIYLKRSSYNALYPISIFDFPEEDLVAFDLFLLIDTLEHWHKDKAKELIKKLSCYGDVLISTPKNVSMYHEHFYGDPRHHITQWNKSDFSGKDFSTPQSYIYLIPKNEDTLC